MGPTLTDARLIRPRIEDADTIAAWSVSSAEAMRWWSRDDNRSAADAILHWWQSDDVQAWTLVDEVGQPLGYGEVWLDEEEDEVELAHILVDPERRRAGVGRALVARLVEAARATGLQACVIRVRPDNEAALGLYRSASFVDVDVARAQEWNQEQPTKYAWLERVDFGG